MTRAGLIQINSAAVWTFCHNVEAHIRCTSVPACLVVVFLFSVQRQPADFWSLVEATNVECLSPFHFKTDTSSAIKITKITVYLTGKEHIFASSCCAETLVNMCALLRQLLTFTFLPVSPEAPIGERVRGDNLSAVPHLTFQHNRSTINKLKIVTKHQIFTPKANCSHKRTLVLASLHSHLPFLFFCSHQSAVALPILKELQATVL